MKALWHNCPDAQEQALQKVGDPASLPDQQQQRDYQYMEQKLHFTRLRQKFVGACKRFKSAGGNLGRGSPRQLRSDVALLETECEKLIAQQPDEQMSMLPGLIGKRDSIMLLSRMQDIVKKLLD